MSGQAKTLALIALFVVLMVGSFIWFVASWDPAGEQPVGNLILPETFA